MATNSEIDKNKPKNKLHALKKIEAGNARLKELAAEIARVKALQKEAEAVVTLAERKAKNKREQEQRKLQNKFKYILGGYYANLIAKQLNEKPHANLESYLLQIGLTLNTAERRFWTAHEKELVAYIEHLREKLRKKTPAEK